MSKIVKKVEFSLGEKNLRFLKIKKAELVDEVGNTIILRGINLGGWLMMEGYILGGDNIAEKEFKRHFKKSLGGRQLNDFERLFRDNFIREVDIKRISGLGANCIRLPFNYRLIEKDSRPYKYQDEGLQYLDRAIDWCQRYRIYCILDLHAVPGSQNADWHSDSEGRSLFWQNKTYRERFFRLWEFLAERYKDKPSVAGYDVLNEPVCDDPRKILSVYKEVVKTIRLKDRRHVIFLEGNRWAQELSFLKRSWADNIAFSIHFYQPLEFTFNFYPHLTYPGKVFNLYWNKSRLKNRLSRYRKIKRDLGILIYVGEFGIHFRCPSCAAELNWLRDTLGIFEDSGFSWTYWTYKAVAMGLYPDGIWQYLANPACINRQGPVSGWQTYYKLWDKKKKNIVASWRSEEYTENKPLTQLLAKFFKG